MTMFKRFAEWYLGLTPADAGQGTAWDFQARFPPGRLPLWMFCLLAAGAAALIVWLYRRDAAGASRVLRGALIVLRTAAVGLLVAILAEPTLTVDRTGLPTLAILIDTSASMHLEDRYADAAVQQRADELLRGSGFQRASRLNLVKSLLLRNDGRLLESLSRTHKLRIYEFSDGVRPVADEATGEADLRSRLATVRRLAADGSQTRPGPSLRQVLDDFRGAPPTAVVLFTDGITTTGEADRLPAAAEAARRRSVQLIVVGVGSDEPARDVDVYDVLAEEVAFVDSPIAITARLKTFGFAGKTISVELRRVGSDRPLAKGEVKAGQDGATTPVELTWTPTEEGNVEYQVVARLLPGESNAENNVRTKQMRVRREQLRVLLVEGTPRWEFRHLKPLLERDRTIDLGVVLQDSDLDYVQEDRFALPRFPATREELFEYDVLIFGDADPAHFAPGALENIREFVSERGGGVIFIAGERHNPLSYRGTPLESLLPIHLDSAALPPPEDALSRGFQVERTLEGRSRLIFRLADSDAADAAAWQDLPELSWLLHAPDHKPGAEVLAVRSTRSGAGDKLPVVVLQRYGAGQVLFHATDELWRWRRYVEDAYYGRYWAQAIRSLCHAKLIGAARGAELIADRSVYEQGDRIQLRLRFVDPRLHPPADVEPTVTVERTGGATETVELSRLPRSPGVYEGVLTRAAAGSYHAWVSTPTFPEAPPAADFRVELPQREMQLREFNRPELVQAAQIARGRFLTFADVGDEFEEIPTGHPVPLAAGEPIPLWNRWESLLLFCGLLSLEWVLRKRARLV